MNQTSRRMQDLVTAAERLPRFQVTYTGLDTAVHSQSLPLASAASIELSLLVFTLCSPQFSLQGVDGQEHCSVVSKELLGREFIWVGTIAVVRVVPCLE